MTCSTKFFFKTISSLLCTRGQPGINFMRTAPIPQVRSSHEIFSFLACLGFACRYQWKQVKWVEKKSWDRYSRLLDQSPVIEFSCQEFLSDQLFSNFWTAKLSPKTRNDPSVPRTAKNLCCLKLNKRFWVTLSFSFFFLLRQRRERVT